MQQPSRATAAGAQNTAATLSSSIFFDHDYTANEDEYRRARGFITATPRTNFLTWTFWFDVALVISDLLVMLATSLIIFYISSYSARKELGAPEMLMGGADPGILLAFGLAAVWCFSLLCTGTYHRHLMGEGYDLYAAIVQAGVIFLVVASALGFLLRLRLPRWRVVVIALVGCLLTAVERRVWRRILHRFRLHGRMSYPVTIVGTWPGIDKALHELDTNVGLGYLPLAVVPIRREGDRILPDKRLSDRASHDETGRAGEGRDTERSRVDQDQILGRIAVFSRPTRHGLRRIPILTFSSHLPATAKKLGSQVIFLVDSIPRGSRMYSAFTLATQAAGMEMSVPVDSTADINGGYVFSLHNAMDTMPVLTTSIPQFNLTRRIDKRLFDIFFSLIGLTVAALPILFSALAIKLDDGGPVFYRQVRVGQYGRPFTIYKLRTMRVGADRLDEAVARQAGIRHGATFKLKRDPRVTRVGEFLRKTSIDEFPQFFNVLKGDMSFVGPRPQQTYERDQYNSVYSTRLLVKPGLTGLWQISGRSDLSTQQAERLDVYYVAHNSLAGDMAIVLKTIPVLLNHKGAY